MTYKAELVISKKDISYNVDIVKNKVDSKTKIAAVIKANAYGVGGEKIAPILYKEGVRDFFVAHFSEAMKIKKALKRKNVNIYILYDMGDNNCKAIVKNKFTPVLNTEEEILLFWKNFPKAPCIVNVDTGLCRLGINEEEIISLHKKGVFQKLNIAYVMSHFSSANVDNDACEREYKQLLKFKKYFPKEAKYTLSNSGGVFKSKKYHFDMVRIGRCIYGLNPLLYKKNILKNAINLSCQILQVREIKKGQEIGYMGTHKATKDGRIAIINIGYADSLKRSLSNSGFLYYKGQKLPIVGLISMDVATVDISSVKDELKQGDKLEVLGEHQDVDTLGKLADTNGCEILTSLSVRYKWLFR